MTKTLRIAIKLVSPIAFFILLSFINKGWSGLLLLMVGLLIFPTILSVLGLFFFVGKRNTKQVWRSYFFLTLNMVLIAFTAPGITDVGETSSAFTLFTVSEGSIMYKISSLFMGLLSLGLAINIVVQIKALLKTSKRSSTN